MQIAEAVSGFGLLVFAFFARRQLPTEEQTQFREHTRKLLSVSAPGTIEAGGEALQEHRDLLRMLSPLGFASGLLTHLVLRARELQPLPKPARHVRAEPVPAASAPAGPPVQAVPVQKQGEAEEAHRFGVPDTFKFASRKMPRIRTWDGTGPPPWSQDATE